MTPQIDLRRVFAVAAKMNQGEARKLIEISIKALEAQMEVPQQSEGERQYAKRAKSIHRMKSSCDRVLDYARHETLRKIEKHFRETSPVKSAEGDQGSNAAPKSIAERLTFDRPDFTGELLAALREEGALALQVAGQQLFDELGRDDPWTMPGDVATAFLDQRANLLANVPDEVHAEIMKSIQDGLDHGDTRKELMSRIGAKFDEISKGRAETIANTETAAAFNYARDKAMREASVTHKKWLHSQSPLIREPRETHIENDGQVRPIDEPFNIGGVKFAYPSDDSLGAGPEDIINCHCVALPVEAPIQSGDFIGHPFRGNQWTSFDADLSKHSADMSDDEIKQAASEFQSLRRESNRLHNQTDYDENMREEHGQDYPYPNEFAETRLDHVRERLSNFRQKFIREFGITGTKYDKNAAGEKYLDSHQVLERSFAPETAIRLRDRAKKLRG